MFTGVALRSLIDPTYSRPDASIASLLLHHARTNPRNRAGDAIREDGEASACQQRARRFLLKGAFKGSSFECYVRKDSNLEPVLCGVHFVTALGRVSINSKAVEEQSRCAETPRRLFLGPLHKKEAREESGCVNQRRWRKSQPDEAGFYYYYALTV